jgi:hypothetical protein
VDLNDLANVSVSCLQVYKEQFALRSKHIRAFAFSLKR